MKKLFLFLAITLLLTCSGNDDDSGSNEPENTFIGTAWKSYDPILATLYGAGSTRTIEFLTETTCQEIVFRASGPSAGTVVDQGTYIYDGNNISWTVDGDQTTATRYGSVLETTIVINGNPILFQLIE